MIDYGKALEKVQLFREFLVADRWLLGNAKEGQHPCYQFSDGEQITWSEVQREILRLQPLIEDIAREVDPAEDVNRFERTTYHSKWNWGSALDATERLIGILKGREDHDAIFGPKGPMLAAEGLHKWVWAAAVNLWDDGHFKQAVGTAAAAVEQQAQIKLQRPDLNGSSLFTKAFTTDPPKPNEPRLRFVHIEERAGSGKPSLEWKSAHEGAMSFGRGCFQGIRNLTAHGTSELTEQQALEYLAALSVLARWVDAAKVDAAPSEPGG